MQRHAFAEVFLNPLPHQAFGRGDAEFLVRTRHPAQQSSRLLTYGVHHDTEVRHNHPHGRIAQRRNPPNQTPACTEQRWLEFHAQNILPNRKLTFLSNGLNGE